MITINFKKKKIILLSQMNKFLKDKINLLAKMEKNYMLIVILLLVKKLSFKIKLINQSISRSFLLQNN